MKADPRDPRHTPGPARQQRPSHDIKNFRENALAVRTRARGHSAIHGEALSPAHLLISNAHSAIYIRKRAHVARDFLARVCTRCSPTGQELVSMTAQPLRRRVRAQCAQCGALYRYIYVERGELELFNGSGACARTFFPLFPKSFSN